MSFVYLAANVLMISHLKFSECARILSVFPVASISHQKMFRPLTHELAKRGHEVVVVTTDPAFSKDKTPNNLTEIDVHDISYKFWHQHDAVKEDKRQFYSQYAFIFHLHNQILDQQLKNEEVKKIINNAYGNFDLLVIEACVKSILTLSYLYKIPVVQISSFGALFHNYEAVGAPTHSIIYSSIMRQRVYNLNIWEKLRELKNYFMFQRLYQYRAKADKQMLKNHILFEIPSFDDLQNNIDMLFLNIHPSWEGCQPVPLNVIYMSGIYQKSPKVLPEDLQTFMDSSSNGVIYFSLGSNILPSLLPKQTIDVIMNVLSQLPYNVLLKWDKGELLKKSDNIKISKWFPQTDLLKHRNMKIFITQGGLQSTDEAIAAGVPLIGLPLMLDQWYNSEKYIYHKIGLQLDVSTMTEDDFRNRIVEVIENDSYRNNIVKLRSLMSDQPQKPLARIMWWTEYVLRHGGARHIRAPSANMPWTEYFELELLLIFLLTILFIIYIALSVIYKLYYILIYSASKMTRCCMNSNKIE